MFNPTAAGARNLRLLQTATKTLQLDKMRFSAIFELNLMVFVSINIIVKYCYGTK